MTTLSPSRLARIALTFVVLAWWASGPAMAAPPANDDFDSATRIPALPYTATLNTAEATAAADDPACTFGPTPTVWYSFTPTANVRVRATTLGSDYDTIICVFTGTRGNLTDITGNDDVPNNSQSLVDFDATAGQTYVLMIGTSNGKGPGQPGGNLVLTVDVAPPPLTIRLSVDEVGSVDRAGNVTLRGTVTCSRPELVQVLGRARQRAGRLIIDGSGFTILSCDGRTPWEMTVNSGNALFKGGLVVTFFSAQTFDFDTGEFAVDQALTVVRLRGSR